VHRTTNDVPQSPIDELLYGDVGQMWSNTGENFLSELVQHLSAVLEAKMVMVGELLPDSTKRMRTVTACVDGDVVEGVDYALAGTPSEVVITRQLCYYSCGVAQLFPQDRLLAELGLESYLGAPLIGRGGQALGVLVVLHDQPLPDPERARTLLQFCAIRAAAELEYLRVMDELRKRELRYRALFDSANDAILVGRKNRVAECNPRALKLFGCTAQQMLGKSAADLSPLQQPDGQSSIEKTRALTVRALAGESMIFEWKCRRADGTLFDAEISLRALDIGGEHLIHSLVRDITERKRAQDALQQSEERFEKAFRLSPESMSILTIDGRHVDINQVALEKLGLQREEVIGRNAEELGIEVEPSGPLLEEFRNTTTIRNRERRFRSRSGQVLTMLLSAEVIQIGGQPHILVMAPDITERKRTERALQQSDERFKKAFRFSPIPMAIAKLNGGIVDANHTALTKMEFSLSEVLGRTTDELGISVEPAARLREELRKAGMRIRNRETQYRSRSGQLLTMLVSAELIQIDGEPHILWMGPDITEQKLHEDSMRMLGSAVASAADAILITDATLDRPPAILYANPAFTGLTGYTPGELAGRTVLGLLGAASDCKITNDIRQALRDWNQFHGEVEDLTKEGKPLHLQLDIVPVQDRDGKTTQFVAIRRDIAHRRLETLNRKRLLRLVLEAQAAEQRRISRELHDHAGQLLTSMLLRLEALQQSTASPSVKQAVREISSVASTTLEELSRLARGLHPAVLDDLGLVEALRRAMEEFEGAGISTQLLVEGIEERLLQNVEHEIYQIVKEALTNVRKHAQARHVVLSLQQRGAVIAASVADDGVGFDYASGAAGRGLGIIGMNERAALLGGSLRVHSRPNAGSVITVTVPLQTPLEIAVGQ
jgi:PAS domain S-box-containing protein